jgi:hypothetical protein
VHEGSAGDGEEAVEQREAGVEQEHAEDLDRLAAELGQVGQDVSRPCEWFGRGEGGLEARGQLGPEACSGPEPKGVSWSAPASSKRGHRYVIDQARSRRARQGEDEGAVVGVVEGGRSRPDRFIGGLGKVGDHVA